MIPDVQDEQLKARVHDYWNADPCGTQFTHVERGSKEFYDEVERFRYTIQPFMEKLCKFKEFRGKKLLEVGCGLGTDTLQFARNGALTTGVDLTENSVAFAEKRFALYGVPGEFRTADAENLPFPDDTFDVVYSFGVLHHTPRTQTAINEVHRVVKSGGGQIVIMLYHKQSLHVWLGTLLFFLTGLLKGKWRTYDDWVRVYDGSENPLGKAYSRSELREMFAQFRNVRFAVCDPLRRHYPRFLNIINQKFFASWSGFWVMIYAEK